MESALAAAALGSREGRDSRLVDCDTAGRAAKMSKVATNTDNEGLLCDICPLSVLGKSGNAVGLHLTDCLRLLKYRQGYHPI
jgi:hypothetical protein